MKIYVYLCCQEKELEAFEIPVASVIVAACDRFRAFSENLVSRVEFGDCATQRNDSVLPHRFGAKTYNLLKETLNCRLLGDYFFSGDWERDSRVLLPESSWRDAISRSSGSSSFVPGKDLEECGQVFFRFTKTEFTKSFSVLRVLQLVAPPMGSQFYVQDGRIQWIVVSRSLNKLETLQLC